MAEGYRIWPDRISTSYGTQPILLKEVAEIDSDYLEWILNADFSEEVRGIIRKAIKASNQ